MARFVLLFRYAGPRHAKYQAFDVDVMAPEIPTNVLKTLLALNYAITRVRTRTRSGCESSAFSKVLYGNINETMRNCLLGNYVSACTKYNNNKLRDWSMDNNNAYDYRDCDCCRVYEFSTAS